MINYFREYDLVGVWIIHVVSVLLASLLRRSKLLTTYNNGNAHHLSSISRIFKITTCALIAYALFDFFILRLIYRIHYVGLYTDWILYCVFFILMDIMLIGLWPDPEAKEKVPFVKLADYYRALRLLYVFALVARIVVGDVMAGSFSTLRGYVIGDYDRGNETETYKGIFFELKTFGIYQKKNLIIYKRFNAIFKKEIHRIEDIGLNASASVNSLPYVWLSSDTIIFETIVPQIFIHQKDGYLLTNNDDRLEEYSPYYVDGKARDTVISIELK